MIDLVASGRIAPLILLLMALEAVVILALSSRLRARGLRPLGLLANLSSGAALVYASYTMVNGSSASLTAACLGTAFLFHALDLWLRFPRS